LSALEACPALNGRGARRCLLGRRAMYETIPRTAAGLPTTCGAERGTS
jgi:hypothetical protein